MMLIFKNETGKETSFCNLTVPAGYAVYRTEKKVLKVAKYYEIQEPVVEKVVEPVVETVEEKGETEVIEGVEETEAKKEIKKSKKDKK